MADKRRIYPEGTYERIAELREQGRGYDEIAAIVGCSRSLVSWACLKLAAEAPKGFRQNTIKKPSTMRNGMVVRYYTSDEDRRLIDLERQGLNYNRIARLLGRTRNSVHARLMTLARRDETTAITKGGE